VASNSAANSSTSALSQAVSRFARDFTASALSAASAWPSAFSASVRYTQSEKSPPSANFCRVHMTLKTTPTVASGWAMRP
jgi:hypothetical protein